MTKIRWFTFAALAEVQQAIKAELERQAEQIPGSKPKFSEAIRALIVKGAQVSQKKGKPR